MKTAMQELIDKVEHAISYNVEGGLVEKYTWEELSNDMYVLLEKEKEQIIDAWQEAYVTGCVVGSNDYTNENEETDNGAYYYNQTFNQNK